MSDAPLSNPITDLWALLLLDLALLGGLGNCLVLLVLLVLILLDGWLWWIVSYSCLLVFAMWFLNLCSWRDTLNVAANDKGGVVGKLDVQSRLVTKARKFTLEDVGVLGFVNIEVWREGVALTMARIRRAG